MELVILESPWRTKSSAEQLRNRNYAVHCMRDSISRGEAPFASHLLYTQFLSEENPQERSQGIEMGLLWGQKAARTVVYQDLGITQGMNLGIRRAIEQGRPVEYRSIPGPMDHRLDSLDALTLEISDFFGIKPKELKSAYRGEQVAIARMVYYKVARRMFPGVSFSQIGRIVNHNHSTVLLGIKRLELKGHLTHEYNRFCEAFNLKF